MQTRSPLAAASGPPLTPQSTTVTPCGAPSARSSSTVAEGMVLTMTTAVPGAAPANTPSGPWSTARTWASSNTDTRTTSLRAASAAGVSATWPPSRNGAVASSRRSQTETSTPAARSEDASPPADVAEADDARCSAPSHRRSRALAGPPPGSSGAPTNRGRHSPLDKCLDYSLNA